MTERDDRLLLLLAAVLGMASIIALPLSLVIPGSVQLMVFATPLLLVAGARLHQQAWLFPAGIGIAVVLLAAILLDVQFLAVVAALILFAGPIAAVVIVGLPLRDRDLIAAGSFLLSATIAVIAGFAGGNAVTGAAVTIIGIAIVGLVLVASRVMGAKPNSAT